MAHRKQLLGLLKTSFNPKNIIICLTHIVNAFCVKYAL